MYISNGTRVVMAHVCAPLEMAIYAHMYIHIYI